MLPAAPSPLMAPYESAPEESGADSSNREVLLTTFHIRDFFEDIKKTITLYRTMKNSIHGVLETLQLIVVCI